jgi:hypothetical protein
MHGEPVDDLRHEGLQTAVPPSGSCPAIVRVLARELRPGDVVVVANGGDPHELTVVGHPWTATCGERVHVDVRTRLGVMPKVWGRDDELKVRRGGRPPASTPVPPA